MSQDARVVRYHADALDVIPTLADESVDAVVTDPPYELGFMGRAWDASGIAYNVDLWKQCFRVLKPGGHLLAFGGTRTSHRLAVAVEDAGFEIRDSIVWIYGSGFPKSLDVSKAIDKRPGISRHAAFAAHLAERRSAAGLSRADVSERVVGSRTGACWNWEHHQFPEAKWWPALRDLLGLDSRWGVVLAEVEREVIGRNERPAGWFTAQDGHDVTTSATDDAKRWAGWGTALKPAHEPIVVARKPLDGRTVAANVLAHGTGALNIDACRVEHASEADLAESLAKNPGRSDLVTSGTYGAGRPQQSVNSAGRWPANVVLDEDAAAELDEQSGVRRPGERPAKRSGIGYHDNDRNRSGTSGEREVLGTGGGASRFFPVFRYQAKAPTRERPKYWRPSCNCETVKPWQGQSPQRATDGSGSDVGRSWSTSMSGSGSTAGQSPPDTTSITEMATNSTMIPEIFSSSQNSSTNGFIPDVNSATTAGGSPAPSVDDSSRSAPSIGTSRPKAGRSTVAADPATLSEWSEISVCANCGASAVREAHSTVKPLELMRWLVRLVTQPDGVVLEPFAGSGTTVEACVLEGMRCLAIEREESYLPLIAARMERAGLVAW